MGSSAEIDRFRRHIDADDVSPEFLGDESGVTAAPTAYFDNRAVIEVDRSDDFEHQPDRGGIKRAFADSEGRLVVRSRRDLAVVEEERRVGHSDVFQAAAQQIVKTAPSTGRRGE